MPRIAAARGLARTEAAERERKVNLKSRGGMMEKSNKVFRVVVGVVLPKSGESPNWSAYVVVATDAKDAIAKAEKKFQRGEYAESVELIIELED